MLERGLYEKTIGTDLRRELDAESDELVSQTERLDHADAARVLAAYAEEAVKQALDSIEGDDAPVRQARLVNSLIDNLASQLKDSDSRLSDLIEGERVDLSRTKPEQLLSLVPRQNASVAEQKKGLVRPLTSVAQTSLFTGAAHEPQLFSELRREIASADEILMLVSFVKWSGLRLLMDALQEFADRGSRIRVITTTYMGATDPKAVSALAALPGASVRVSYDTKRTRLHAKAYVFRRKTGYTTAYVGSSNLTNPAMTSGLEWNLKISRADEADALDKIEGTFDAYWASPDFEPYTAADSKRLASAIAHEHGGDAEGLTSATYAFDIRPYPYQQKILDALEAERTVGGHWKNLVVAATGTGKTVIAAFDYRRFCEREGQRVHLLFVAHRQEILEQARSCFRGILHDQNFGSLLVGNHHPESYAHLFASVQSFQSQRLWEKVSAGYFDCIVVDEIHHGAADSYQAIFNALRPKVLLGLTATPERMDGQSILPYFDDRIAAEISLADAIERKLLCPFTYFGVSDPSDLSGLTWKRGGYETSELEQVYVFNEKIAERRCSLILEALSRYVTDVSRMHALGFCVSKAHARFMAERFQKAGIPAVAVTADMDEDGREKARTDLADGTIKIVFAVDIYNEGVDIPEIDTVLFLRPTESLTIFMQQLGRGLRLAPGKECLTVLDFIGQQNRRYDFAPKLRALLASPTHALRREVEEGFPEAPKGCYIRLERVAQEYVLKNLAVAQGTRSRLVSALATFEEDAGQKLTLGSFLAFHHLDIRAVYKVAPFERLLVEAGLEPGFEEPDEAGLTKAFPRLCTIDSRRWIRFLLSCLDNADKLIWDELTSEQQRMLDMFQITLWPDSFRREAHMKVKEGSPEFDNALECLQELASEPHMARDVRRILAYRLDHIDFIDEELSWGFPCPLDLHCQYSRDQIFLALGRKDPQNMRQGVAYLRDCHVDVLLNTLQKSDKEFSPETRYEDYSIDERHFHWQSQNKTTPESETGQRYQTGWDAKDKVPAKIALFVREEKADQYGTEPYTFLGFVQCESASGSRPMNIVWKLEAPIPARFIQKTARLAG